MIEWPVSVGRSRRRTSGGIAASAFSHGLNSDLVSATSFDSKPNCATREGNGELRCARRAVIGNVVVGEKDDASARWFVGHALVVKPAARLRLVD